MLFASGSFREILAACKTMKFEKGPYVQVLICLQSMSEIIEEADVMDMQRLQMQRQLTTFEDILGGCERLLRTPIPLSYARHATRFLLLWLIFFPIVFASSLGNAVVPVTAMVGFLMFGAHLSLCTCEECHTEPTMEMPPGDSATLRPSAGCFQLGRTCRN